MKVKKADDYQSWYIEEGNEALLIDPWFDFSLVDGKGWFLQRKKEKKSHLTEDEISQVQKLKGVEFDYWYGVDGSYFKITKEGALEGPFNSYSLPYDEQTQLTEGNEYKVIVNTSFIHNVNSNVVSTGDENSVSDYPNPNTYYASLP